METDIIKQYIIQEDNIVIFDNETYLVKPLFNSKDVESYVSIAKKGAANCYIYLRLCSDTVPAKKELILKCSTPDLELCSKMERVPVFNQKAGKYVSRFRIKATVENIYDIIHAKAVSLSWDQNKIKAKTSLDDSLLTGFFIQTRGLSCIPESQQEVIDAAERKAKELQEEERKKKMEEEEQKRLAAEKEKEKQREEQRKKTAINNWKKEQVKRCTKLLVPSLMQLLRNDPKKDMGSYRDTYQIHTNTIETNLKKEIKPIIDSLKKTNEEFAKEKENIIKSEGFINDVINGLEKKKIFTKIDYASYGPLRFPHYLLSKDLTEQLALDVIDGKSTYNQIVPKLLVGSYIRRAVLATNIITKEYRVYDYNYSADGAEVLRQKGIISQSYSEEYSWDSGHHGEKYCVLYVNDYNKACDIIDGKAESTVKNTNMHQGCYIATCVYGSYDCPEVWTLRRFRDQSLRNSWLGRVFIKVYYATSPTLVRWFGGMESFRTFNRRILDIMVSNLIRKGFENKPYLDK